MLLNILVRSSKVHLEPCKDLQTPCKRAKLQQNQNSFKVQIRTVHLTRFYVRLVLCISDTVSCVSLFLLMTSCVQWDQLLLSDDAVAAFSEEIILFVKFSLILSNSHIETLLLKVWLLLLTDGGLLQHLWTQNQIQINSFLTQI